MAKRTMGIGWMTWCVGVVVVVCVGGCDGWKRADAGVSLLPVWGVDAVKVEGRELIRIRSRHGEADVDARGGAVVSYRLMPPPRFRFEPSPDREAEMTVEPIAVKGEANVLAGDGWMTQSVPGGEKRDRGVMWVVDGEPRMLVLLGDEEGGLRWRKTYALSESGELLLTVSLENAGWSEVTTGARSIVQRAETRHLERHVVEVGHEAEEATTPDTVELPPRRLGPGERIQWEEHWRIRRALPVAMPATLPATQPAMMPVPSSKQ